MKSSLQISCLIILLGLVSQGFAGDSNVTCDYIKENCNAYLLNGTQTYANYSNLDSAGLIKLFGYPVEVHNITTNDGYIIKAHRIPYSNQSADAPGKIPVFLMHGIFASSAQWFWQPAERALVFMLADAGFDVWIGNARGTSYSSAHKTLSTKCSQFWDFSSYEMGKYDIPAILDYITNNTSQPSLYYIGHSLGTTQLFTAATLNPGLQSKIRTFFALAPVAYKGNRTNIAFRASAPVYGPYPGEQLAQNFTGGPVLPSFLQNRLVNFTQYCANSAVDCSLCQLGFFALFGLNPCQTNFTTMPGFLAHLPDSVSAKTFSHDLQGILDGSFKLYDYGAIKNLQLYGSLKAPDYDWSNYGVPTVIFHSDNDNLAVNQDTYRTALAIGSNLKEINRIPLPDWTHMDFVTGKDADIYVYNRIIEIMKGQLYG